MNSMTDDNRHGLHNKQKDLMASNSNNNNSTINNETIETTQSMISNQYEKVNPPTGYTHKPLNTTIGGLVLGKNDKINKTVHKFPSYASDDYLPITGDNDTTVTSTKLIKNKIPLNNNIPRQKTVQPTNNWTSTENTGTTDSVLDSTTTHTETSKTTNTAQSTTGTTTKPPKHTESDDGESDSPFLKQSMAWILIFLVIFLLLHWTEYMATPKVEPNKVHTHLKPCKLILGVFRYLHQSSMELAQSSKVYLKQMIPQMSRFLQSKAIELIWDKIPIIKGTIITLGSDCLGALFYCGNTIYMTTCHYLNGLCP